MNAYLPPLFPETFENYRAVDLGKKGIVTPAPYVLAGMKSSAALADQNTAGAYRLPAETFYPEPFSYAVAAVTGTAACFFMGHDLSL